jgi:hypothetical protein
MWSTDGMILTGGKTEIFREKIGPSATLAITNSIWNSLGFIVGFYCQRQATDNLNHGTFHFICETGSLAIQTYNGLYIAS